MKTGFLDQLDQDDYAALREHLTRNLCYSPFWGAVDINLVTLALEAWTAGCGVEKYPEINGDRVAVHVPTSITTAEQLASWCREYLDDEQLDLLKKYLAYARRNRRVYLTGNLFPIKDELKKRFKAKWDVKSKRWHVHYKQANSAMSYIQEMRDGS